MEQRAAANFREIEQNKEAATVVETKNVATTDEKLSFEQQKQQKSVQNKLNKIENNITLLEKELKEMDILMGEQVQSDVFYKEYEQKKQMLEDLMTEWEALIS